MATCPTCQRRDAMTLDRTADHTLVARPLGSFSLSGAQLKVSAYQVPVFVLACDRERGGCGWNIRGRIDGDDLIPIGPPDHSPVTDVPDEPPL